MKFIIILGIIFYFLPKIMRFSLKWFISNQMDKVQKDFKAAQQPQRKEGEIKVDIKPNTKGKTETFEGGEYIDYEEVK